MRTENNLINRLVLHLIYQSEISERDAMTQSQVCYKNYVEHTVKDVLEKFEHYDISVHEINIDLGTVVPEEIPDKLHSALERELEKYICEKGILQNLSGKNKDTGSVIKIDMDETGREAVIHYDNPLSCLLEYLKNPQVPWYISSDQPFDIETLAHDVSDKCLCDDDHLRQLVSVISRDRRIYHRFCYLIQADTLDLIIRRYMTIHSARSDSEVMYADVYNEIDQLLTRYPSYKKEAREWFFESLLLHLPVKRQVTPSEKEFVQSLFHTNKNSKESFQGADRFPVTIPEEKQRYMIHNAGLVIFNPMIPTFFRHLGYLDQEDRFKSIRHQIRAVHLLQVLTGIRSKHYDHLLHLNKIICGLDAGFPIDPAFRITKREKEEATDLLESVLDHWSVLKGTSVGGFQESFVQRDGVIEKNGRDWIVHVENKSIDILLDDLPWSINLLPFPWNEFVIHVDWKS